MVWYGESWQGNYGWVLCGKVRYGESRFGNKINNLKERISIMSMDMIVRKDNFNKKLRISFFQVYRGFRVRFVIGFGTPYDTVIDCIMLLLNNPIINNNSSDVWINGSLHNASDVKPYIEARLDELFGKLKGKTGSGSDQISYEDLPPGNKPMRADRGEVGEYKKLEFFSDPNDKNRPAYERALRSKKIVAPEDDGYDRGAPPDHDDE